MAISNDTDDPGLESTDTLFLGSLRSEFDVPSELPEQFGVFKQAFDTATQLYQKGAISGTELANLLSGLKCYDVLGVEWTIGSTTGLWYRRLSGHWVSSGPPLARASDATPGAWQQTVEQINALNAATLAQQSDPAIDSPDQNVSTITPDLDPDYQVAQIQDQAFELFLAPDPGDPNSTYSSTQTQPPSAETAPLPPPPTTPSTDDSNPMPVAVISPSVPESTADRASVTPDPPAPQVTSTASPITLARSDNPPFEQPAEQPHIPTDPPASSPVDPDDYLDSAPTSAPELIATTEPAPPSPTSPVDPDDYLDSAPTSAPQAPDLIATTDPAPPSPTTPTSPVEPDDYLDSAPTSAPQAPELIATTEPASPLPTTPNPPTQGQDYLDPNTQQYGSSVTNPLSPTSLPAPQSTTPSPTPVFTIAEPTEQSSQYDNDPLALFENFLPAEPDDPTNGRSSG